ncbi:MAG: hypothetical protein OXK76_07770 [Gammaproteobacteria bacterium]|nr:hypothetical protein [Gammaproteobacteria bacterium]
MKKQVHRATFDLSGKKVPGILTLKGRRSTLDLWNDEFFHVFGGTLHGTTADAKAVSVLDCLESHPTSTSGKEHSGFRGSVTFGLVTVGHGQHLDADDEAVIAVEFSFEELECLSRTGVSGPYGYIPDPDPALIESLRQHKPDYMPDVGDGAMLAYFGGETTVLSETPTNNRVHVKAFLTDTLEFVYGVAELIECGWNAQRLAHLQPGDHPFATYLKVYDLQLSRSAI